LAEVVIAVFILATSITFILRAFTTSVLATKKSTRVTMAALVAEQMLWKARALYAQEEQVELPAQVEQGGTVFKIASTMSPLDQLSNITEMNLTVSWDESKSQEPSQINVVAYLKR
jgi:Tfp pilus assembly protein PilV